MDRLSTVTPENTPQRPEASNCLSGERFSRRTLLAAALAVATGGCKSKSPAPAPPLPSGQATREIPRDDLPPLDPDAFTILSIPPPDSRSLPQAHALRFTGDAVSTDEELRTFIEANFRVYAGNCAIEEAKVICLTDIHTEVFSNDNASSSSLISLIGSEGDIVLVEAAFTDDIQENPDVLASGGLKISDWDDKSAHQAQLHVITRLHNAQKWLRQHKIEGSNVHKRFINEWKEWIRQLSFVRNDSMRRKIRKELAEREGTDSKVFVWGGSAHFKMDPLLLADLSRQPYVILDGITSYDGNSKEDRRRLNDLHAESLIVDRNIHFYRPPDVSQWYRMHGRSDFSK